MAGRESNPAVLTPDILSARVEQFVIPDKSGTYAWGNPSPQGSAADKLAASNYPHGRNRH